MFSSPKSGKPRTIAPAASAFEALRRQRVRQMEQQLRLGPIWSNPHGLVFTSQDGGVLSQPVAEAAFDRVCSAAGLDGIRFHDGAVIITLNQQSLGTSGVRLI